MTKADPQLDQTYVIKLNGQVWPVVVCYEERMPDRELERRQEKHQVAVIVLGYRQYCWVNPANLRTYNPDINHAAVTKSTSYDEGSSLAAQEEKRCIAFKQDAPMLKDANFWHNYIHQEKVAAPMLLSRQSRSISTSPTNSGRSCHSETRPKVTARKRSASPTLDACREPKRRLSQPQRDALTAGEGPVSYHFPTHEDIVALKDEATDHEYIAVVGRRALPLLISRLGVERVPVMKNCRFPSRDYGDYLPLTMEMPHISAKEFKAVAEFLAIGAFAPKLRELPPSIEYEEGDDLEPVIDHAKTISLAYRAASWFQMPDLQADCMKKLRHMGALSGPALMGLEAGSRGCDQWGMEERSSLHGLALHGLARDFFKIMEIDGVVLSTYLQEKKSPMMEITRRLCAANGAQIE
ncbi:hypothetical protein B0A48_04075 [Cryoendolithus antarcticus]|uniref:PWWP domain-containing protein n=1 Tax=Cryoendolithus antarcticus TaxID=1507870 RepID=A0A1V8THC7_9PEZI|nr:hypothetical protein B0A48_04075 [Cryoendolithus antarcticus]